MLRILKHLRWKEWLLVAACVVLIVGQVQLDLALPDYMSEITRLVQTEGSQMSDILLAGGKMLLCALGSMLLTVCTTFFTAQIASRFSARLRGEMYRKVVGFSNEEINRFSTASLITRTTNDISQLQMFFSFGMQSLIKAPLMAFIAVGKISTKSWEWSLLTGGVIAFVCVLLVFIMLYAVPRMKKMQTLTDNLNRITRENLTGLQVVRAYNAENYQEGKFAKANEEMTRNSQQANIAMSVMNPGMNLAMNGLTLGIYWIGAALISAIAVTSPAAMMERIGLFSDMVVFMQYAMQVIMAFLMLVMIFVMLPRVTVSAGRVNEVLDTKARIVDGKETQGKPGMKGEIEFRDVSFRYPDADGDTIHHISFTAHHGQTVALIGATGCGKSSIINLIPRLYDATSGQVLVDGVDVRDYTQDALRSKIGFVPQKAFLFSGTVSSNVGYGEDNASGAAIRKAVAIAQAAEFVESPEVGYSGTVAQGGSNFSGGQKQRLSIARAVARDPEILVFDDSFSALDYKTDRALRQALRQQTGGTTNIIVAQRIGTIRDADCILVIEDGAIVGKGTHRELMESCKVYQEIAYSQLSKEELAS
ncbi:MAG TPA: multidrug ABC transporter ATP-binding protein [Clostridiales bacterium]|nr:multidrug ABC transporter ATP-binding protein [Clostridiales bacterium]HCJ88088.1 multidrug ABC transporter ATP-binding protein [Clostridiales bacterium]